MHSRSSILLHSVSHVWPDGTPSLINVSASFAAGRTGLVGRNGSGKSTLLRLIAGELTPSSGSIDTVGEVATLPQTLTLRAHDTIATLLGVSAKLEALRAIESGDVSERHFDTVGDDWDIEARSLEALDQLGFPGFALDRRVGELSGGEAMLIAIMGLRIRRAEITLLDEPTNNLDRSTRERLGELVRAWPGTLVVVSHDVELLELMDHTAELWGGELTTFGGPYSAWREHLDTAQAAATQAAQAAKQALRSEKRQRVEAETMLARRDRTAKKAQRDGGIPKIVANHLASKARASAGSMRTTLDDRVRDAQAAVDASDARVRGAEHISLELPDPGVPRGRRIAEFSAGARSFIVQGPERVALIGPNGSGKTRLLTQLMSGASRTDALPLDVFTTKLHTDRVGYLPQRLDNLNDSASALANVRDRAPDVAEGEIRNLLARLLIRGPSVDRPVHTLSGGERFRVALACLLFAQPPSQLLILDEPTNNLDIDSVEHLAQALDAFRGALIVVSHDPAFLRRIRVDRVLELDGTGGLVERLLSA